VDGKTKFWSIGLVVGEVSGDMLGAGLVKQLKKILDDVEFRGIAGPLTQAEGCKTLYPMEKLSIIGLVEALGKFRAVLKIRKALVQEFLDKPPDIFIGIDVPDFNLGLEKRLKQAGIPTVHYVSPTVWAWRGYRIKSIHKAVNRMLALFPFEEVYYRRHNIPVTFVGHPMAERIEREVDRKAYRKKLGLPEDRTIIALLPGSRSSELIRHSKLFIRTAAWLLDKDDSLLFVAPFVNRKTRKIFNRAVNKLEAWDYPVKQVDGHSRDVMAAADIVLLASGTATLEAAIMKRLMVITYKVSFITSLLVRAFSHVSLYSMPNNLAGHELVPEFMQSDATPENLGAAVIELLTDKNKAESITTELGKIRDQLAQDADKKAAQAVYEELRLRYPARFQQSA